MNPIEEQKSIISELANLIHCSTDDRYDEISCVFTYNRASDGSYSVREQASILIDGRYKSIYLIDDSETKPVKLIPELHKLMKAHTGGDWSAFTLTLDKHGKATTQFKYSE